MQPDQPDATRALPGERLALWVLVLGLIGSLFLLVHGWYDPTNDGSMYIVTGRSIAAGEGYSMLGIPFRIRPAGFAYMIAPILAWRGTDFFALNLLVSAFGALGVVFIFLLFRKRLGWGVAWLLAVAVWMNPGYQQLCNQPMSDVPGTTLLLGCLLLLRWAEGQRSWRADLILGVAIGLSAYVRSVDILLVPAIFAGRACAQLWGSAAREAWKPWLVRLGVLALGAFLVQLPWSLRNARLENPVPADQTLLHSYGSGMWHVDPGDPTSPRLAASDVLGRFPVQTAKVAAVLGNRMTATKGGTTPTVIAVVLLLGSLYVLVKRRGPPEFFVAGTLVIVAFYFGFAPRLLLPVYLLVLPATLESLQDLGRLVSSKWGGGVLAGGALLLLIAVDFGPRRNWEDVERLHAAYELLCSEYEAQLEPDARVAAQRGWHYAVYLDRPVYSLEFAMKRAGRPGAAEELVDEYGLNTIIATPLQLGRTNPLERQMVVPYLERRYGKRPGRAWVVRVRE